MALSFSSRFEEAKGTTPEELIGAAEAGCFSMRASANLGGHPERISTTATVNWKHRRRPKDHATIDSN
jgi:osmotically inducible protein OsmC